MSPDRRASVPTVLLVCAHNAGRSQMAAALLDSRVRALMAELLGEGVPG